MADGKKSFFFLRMIKRKTGFLILIEKPSKPRKTDEKNQLC